MIHNRLIFVLTLVLGGTAPACSSSKANDGSHNNNPGYIVGGNGAGGGGAVAEALQSDGTLLIKGTIRDFHDTYPDMEPCSHNSAKTCDSKTNEQRPACSSTNQCIVTDALSADGEPQYAGPNDGTGSTTGPINFKDWFHDSDQSAKATLSLSLAPDTNGNYVYNNQAFFPIDGQLFGNDGNDGNGVSHNFHFTTEWHLRFTYSPGQQFEFTGDDDLWVFVNGKLQVDLGGIHNAQSATLHLDALGLTPGSDHDFDIYYCERHVTESHLQISTSIQFNGSVFIN